MNVSTVPVKRLVEEAHAYVMYEVTKQFRCGDKSCVAPHKLEQFARQQVKAWCSNHLPLSNCKTPCAVNTQRPKLYPSIRYTTKQIHQMVIDDILTTGLMSGDGNLGAGSSARGDQRKLNTNNRQAGQLDSIVCDQSKQTSKCPDRLSDNSSNSHSMPVKKERMPKVMQVMLRFISGSKAAKISSELTSQ